MILKLELQTQLHFSIDNHVSLWFFKNIWNLRLHSPFPRDFRDILNLKPDKCLCMLLETWTIDMQMDFMRNFQLFSYGLPRMGSKSSYSILFFCSLSIDWLSMALMNLITWVWSYCFILFWTPHLYYPMGFLVIALNPPSMG